jgi:hypothetical protein
VAAPIPRARAQSANWGGTSGAKTVTLTGLQVGDIIGLFAATADFNLTWTSAPATTAGSTSAWTLQQTIGVGGTSCRIQFHTATVLSAGNVTISATPSGAQAGLYAFAYPSDCTFGDRGIKYANASTVPMDISNPAGNGTWEALVTTAANAGIEVLCGDWTANTTMPSAGERRETDAGTQVQTNVFVGDGTNWGVVHGYYADAGAAGAKNVGWSTARRPSIMGIEVQGGAGLPADNTPKPATIGMYDPELIYKAWF